MDDLNDYAPLRDTQKHQIIMKLFKDEFDLTLYQEEGVVSDFFPLHHYKKRRYIMDYWWKEKMNFHFFDLFK